MYYIFFKEKVHIFTIFWDKILAQYSPKRTKLHNKKNWGGGRMPLNPSNKRVALPRVAYSASRHANTPDLFKNILNPPPKKNEILDTPLSNIVIN